MAALHEYLGPLEDLCSLSHFDVNDSISECLLLPLNLILFPGDTVPLKLKKRLAVKLMKQKVFGVVYVSSRELGSLGGQQQIRIRGCKFISRVGVICRVLRGSCADGGEGVDGGDSAVKF